jgi:hypothetical protein
MNRYCSPNFFMRAAVILQDKAEKLNRRFLGLSAAIYRHPDEVLFLITLNQERRLSVCNNQL